jgi:hypothetical protein
VAIAAAAASSTMVIAPAVARAARRVMVFLLVGRVTALWDPP